jgi:hypothetical protein
MVSLFEFLNSLFYGFPLIPFSTWGQYPFRCTWCVVLLCVVCCALCLVCGVERGPSGIESGIWNLHQYYLL